MEIPTGFIDKAKFVRVIFTDVEREYDVLLRLMTLGFDSVWRRRLFAKMDFSKAMIVLDLACGTGLVTFELSRLVNPVGLVLGLDMSPAMLSVANRKKRDLRLGCDVGFVRAVGEFLPFRTDTITYVTVGLALRNFADKTSVFRETLRVLMHAGWFLSLDFVVPENALFWRLYRFHIFHILPELGGLVSGYWKRTLTYLANTILKSSSPNEICKVLSNVGFVGTFFERMTLGVVSLVGGQKTASVT
jgi:demethylmenaquinone methyltransferase/2-methoxy-6-polyprenyl-1,4-benzoquinol methylase